MSLPESHFESLERLLRIHDEQLVTLHTSLEAFTEEIIRREAYWGNAAVRAIEPDGKMGGIPELISQRKMIEQEIETHYVLVVLGRDQRGHETLSELVDNLDLAREVARDARAFATGRGIEIPANMALELDVNEDRISLRITHYDDLVPFVLKWNSDDGFSVPNLDPQ
jgi:hypothetical protein